MNPLDDLKAVLASLPGGPSGPTIAQGVDMGRPSKIITSTGPKGVTVKGQAVKVMQGRLCL